MATADWNGSPPEIGTMTRHTRNGSVWARRKVRPDGSVVLMGHRFVPPADATPAEPGEWLLLYNYGPDHDQRNGPTCGEWTCPAESDGYLRRMFWQVQP